MPDDPKTALRQNLLARRKSLYADVRGARLRAAHNLPAALLTPAAMVAGYRPMGAEIDCAPVLERFEHAGWAVCFPDSEPGFVADGQPAWPDLIITPLVGFDRYGYRLGRGGGWYDRAIALARQHKPVRVIGLAFSGQEADAIPVEPHDMHLDGVLTEVGYTEFGSN